MPESLVRRLRSVQGVFGTPWLESQAYLLAVAVAVSFILLLATGKVSFSNVLVYTLLCGNVTTVGNAILGPFYSRPALLSWFIFVCVQLPLAFLGGVAGSALNHLLSSGSNDQRVMWQDVRFAVTMTLLIDIITFTSYVRATS